MSQRLTNQQALQREWNEICARLLGIPAGHARTAAIRETVEEKRSAGRKGFSLPTIYRKLETYQAQGCTQLGYSELFRNKHEALELHEITVPMVRGWLWHKGQNMAGWCVAHGYRKNALSDLLAGRRGTGDMQHEMVARLAEEIRRDRPAWIRQLDKLRDRLWNLQKEIARMRRALGEHDGPQ